MFGDRIWRLAKVLNRFNDNGVRVVTAAMVAAEYVRLGWLTAGAGHNSIGDYLGRRELRLAQGLDLVRHRIPDPGGWITVEFLRSKGYDI